MWYFFIGFGDFVPTFQPNQVCKSTHEQNKKWKISKKKKSNLIWIGRTIWIYVLCLRGVHNFLVYIRPRLFSDDNGLHCKVSRLFIIYTRCSFEFIYNTLQIVHSNAIQSLRVFRGLRSKHLTRLEKQLADNIKSTQSRIWHGVTKDVSYLRRILSEVYMMKFRVNIILSF